ncbi:MAG: cold shock domain-containing protein [Ferruginibacter sp.]
MGRSQETFNKKENEKKRAKKKQDKAEKMEERKANATKGKSLDDMMAYIDENGNISSKPPDPKKMREVTLEEIEIGVVKRDAVSQTRKGMITNFNESKGYGFIKDQQSNDSIFVHVSSLTQHVKEGDIVTFEVQKDYKGLSATNVRKL